MLEKVCTRLIYLKICDKLGMVVPYAAQIIIHLSVSSRLGSIMIVEDVKNIFAAYCFIWNLAELHDVKIRNQRIC